jgi:hypothetical protein
MTGKAERSRKVTLSGAKEAAVIPAVAAEGVAGEKLSEAGSDDDEDDNGEENLDGLQGFEDVLVRDQGSPSSWICWAAHICSFWLNDFTHEINLLYNWISVGPVRQVWSSQLESPQ